MRSGSNSAEPSSDYHQIFQKPLATSKMVCPGSPNTSLPSIFILNLFMCIPPPYFFSIAPNLQDSAHLPHLIHLVWSITCLIVMDEDTCMVDMARYFLDFTKKESCGKCNYCRIGTKRMLEICTHRPKGCTAVCDNPWHVSEGFYVVDVGRLLPVPLCCRKETLERTNTSYVMLTKVIQVHSWTDLSWKATRTH